MKKQILLASLLLVAGLASAQTSTTIQLADMPVLGDTLRWSAASGQTINYTQTGANQVWNFSTLSPTAQGVDRYQLAAAVNPIYAATISPTAYGYKVADSLPGASAQGISVTDIYTFFNKKNNPARFVAEGFAAKILTLPTPAAYSNEDEVYFLPLSYSATRVDTSSYLLNASVAGLGNLIQTGTRTTRIDGYGTIETPYTTAPVACIRVKSEVVGRDSVNSAFLTMGLPRNIVEYKWLAPGEHYPLLFVTTDRTSGTEVITSVRYRDRPRSLSVRTLSQNQLAFSATPDRASGVLVMHLPQGLNRYQVRLYDAAGRLVASGTEQLPIQIAELPAGLYVVQVQGEAGYGVAKVQL